MYVRAALWLTALQSLNSVVEVVHENALAAHPELTELDTYPLSSSFGALIGKLLAVAAR